MEVSSKILTDQRVELTVVLNQEELRHWLALAEERLAARLAVKGFRPGHFPKDKLREQLGEKAILEEGLSLAVGGSLADALAQVKLDALKLGELRLLANSAQELRYAVEVIPVP